MMKCEVCGIGVREPRTVNEAFFIDGHWVAVQHIPAEVCNHCGEVTFDAKTAEQIRQLVRSEKQPRAMIEMNVYEFV